MLTLLAWSLAPVACLFWFFYVRDRYEKEPPALLMRLFGFGAFSVLPAAALSYMLFRIVTFHLFPEGWLYLAVSNYVAVALIEELVKFYVVIAVAWTHPAFNEPYDGIIYAVTASLGFAAVENILYVYQGGVGVAVGRMLLAVPAHALFGSFMGYYISKARFAHPGQRGGYLALALALPILLHGTYNFLLSTGRLEFALLVVPLSYFMWRSALRQGNRASDNSPFRPLT